ncbi:NAD dependent epimerase/dehydratase family, partial [Haematococcus lacustris]
MELLPCGVAAITGGAGFVGMRLAQKLAAAGQSVVLLDLRPPAPGWQNRFSAEVLAKDANVQSCGISGQDSQNASAGGFPSQAKVSFRQADLRRLGDLLAGFQGVDTVYHVASF